jgi:hypothetical protein
MAPRALAFAIPMRKMRILVTAVAGLAALLAWSGAPDAATGVKVPIVCSRGPSGQTFAAWVSVPSVAAEHATYRVRIDSVPSERLSKTGLNYIHGMWTDYVVPAGARYVEGSAHLVPGTGTANVRAGARVWHDRGTIHMWLPAHVPNGSGYTPPSVEYDLEVLAPAGTSLPLAFARYRVSANVFLLGDLDVTCEPSPRPYPLARTVVTPAL